MPAEPTYRPATSFYDVHTLLTEIMQSLVVFATVAIPVEYLAPEHRFLLYGLFVFALIANAWIRSVCDYIWQFLLLGVIIIALPLLLPILPPLYVTIWPRVIALPVLIFLFCRSFYQRLKQNEEKPLSDPIQQSLTVLYFLAINLVAIKLNLTKLSQAYFYVAILYLMLALYRWHRLSLYSQLERFFHMPTQPVDRIVRFNRLLLIGYCVFTLVLLLISPLLHLHDLLPFIGSVMLAFLRWVIQLISRWLSRSAPLPEQIPPPGEQEPSFPLEPSETARWLLILQQIFYYVMIIVSVLIILALVGYILYALYKRFYAVPQLDSDEAESLLPSLSDQRKKHLHRVRQRLNLPLTRTPAQKIRRCYFRLIESQMKRGLTVKASLTPRQIAEAFDTERYPELVLFTSLYEAARYGPDICTQTDADQAMIWYKNLRKQDLIRRESQNKVVKEAG